MAVSKELLARYKELKAQGINITLSELKAQMEDEGVNNSSPQEVETPKPTGFAALSSHETSNSEPVHSYSTSQQDSSWSTSYYSQPAETKTEPIYENYSSSFETAGAEMLQANSIDSYSNSSSNYSQYSHSQAQQTYNQSFENNSTSYQSTIPTSDSQPYCGNVVSNNSVDTNSYNNNFNADFSWNSQNQNSPTKTVQTEIRKEKYTGNLPPQPSSFFGPSVVSGEVPAPIQNSNQTKYGLIGYPLGHSLSAYIHNAGFKSLGINSEYEILETPPDDLVDRIKYLKFNGYAGFNVTIPLKLPVTLFLDYIDASADLVGAVNTVVINPDKTLKGYNTDVIGFRNAIPSDFTLTGKVAGVLGTGGAARAAITALAQSKVKEIKIYTRNIPNCAELLKFLRNKFQNIIFNVYQIEYIRDLSEVQILVNTTPIGMQGRSADMTPVEEKELKTLPQGALVYDVIYNPKKTLLLKLAERNGYRTINGVDMFIHQALAAEKIWTGRTPDFKDMKIAALENL